MLHTLYALNTQKMSTSIESLQKFLRYFENYLCMRIDKKMWRCHLWFFHYFQYLYLLEWQAILKKRNTEKTLTNFQILIIWSLFHIKLKHNIYKRNTLFCFSANTTLVQSTASIPINWIISGVFCSTELFYFKWFYWIIQNSL